MKEMTPWFKGWNGNIKREESKDRWRLEGIIEEIDDNTVEITELPARMWTITMKEYLLSGLAGTDKQKAWIKDMEEDHGVGIKFIVKLSNEEMEKSRRMGLLERFKLVSSISNSNMVAFDPEGKIKKYATPNEMIKDYYFVRLDYYQRRKNYMVKEYSNQLEKVTSQAKFVKMIIEGKLIVSNKRKKILIEELRNLDFPGFDKSNEPIQMKHSAIKTETEGEQEDDNDEQEVNDEYDEETGLIVVHQKNNSLLYDYLLGMPIWSLTRERYESLLKVKGEKEELLNTLLQKSPKDLWNEDIEEFLIEWDKFLKQDEENKKNLVGTNNDNDNKGTKRKRRAPVRKKETKPKVEKKVIVKKEKKEPTVKKEKVEAINEKEKKVNKTTNNKIKNEKETEALKKEVDDLNDFDSIFKQFSKSSSAFKSTKQESVPSDSTIKKRSAPKSNKKKAKVILSDDESIGNGSDDYISDGDEDDEEVVETKVSRPTRGSRAKTPVKTYSLDSDDESMEEGSDSSYSDA